MKHRIDAQIVLNDKQFALYKSGQSQLMALGKDVNNNQIQFHAPIAHVSNGKNVGVGLLIGVGVAFIAAGIGAITYLGIKSYKKKKYLKEHPEAVVSLEYNTAMTNYIEKAQNKKLSFEDIKRLTDCFDNLIKERKAGNITIDVSDEEINTLYSIIYKISSQIPPEEMTPIDEKCYSLDVFENDSSEAKLEKTRDMLLAQEKVLIKK